jgi:hypothetical protein
MKLEVTKTVPGSRALFVEPGRVIGGRGRELLEWRDDGEWRCIAKFPASAAEAALSAWSFTRLGLRLGIHSVVTVGDGEFLAVLKRRFVLVGKSGRLTEVDRVHRGNKPASRALCATPAGPIFYGEYLLNNDRSSAVAIYRTDDVAKGFKKIHEFPAGEVRHVHFLQWDPHGSCLWMGTGDRDSECRFYRSDDHGGSWQLAGGGSQDWRAVGVAFTGSALFWGMDAGSDAGDTPNFIMRYDRKSRTIGRVQRLQGPAHGVGALADGTLVVSSGVEGGINEADRCAHLWASRDGDHWEEVFARPKKRWPNIIQFGVLRIPPGAGRGDELTFTGLALRGATETVFQGRLIDDRTGTSR